MDSLDIIHRPHLVSPANNPIQYVWNTGGTHEYTYDASCDIVSLIQSEYDVWSVNIKASSLVDGNGFYLLWNGIKRFYQFKDCVSRRNPQHVQLSTSACEALDNLVEAINSDPFAKGNYFALKRNEAVETCSGTQSSNCDGDPFFDIFIVSTQVGANITSMDDITIEGFTYKHECVGADNALSNYRIKVCLFVENMEHNSMEFVNAGTLEVFPKPKLQPSTTTIVDPYRDFSIQLQELIRVYLHEDVPNLTLGKIQYAVNCIKNYFISFGDLYDTNEYFVTEVHQGVDVGSRLEPDVKLKALNAYYPLYGSDYNNNFTSNGNVCIENSSQPYLLKEYFEPNNIYEQKFLTNWVGKELTTDRKEWLHYYVGKGINLALIQGVFEVTYNNGTTDYLISSFDFSDLQACDDKVPKDDQLIMIPLHSVMEGLDFTGVKDFCFYLQHQDCFIPDDKGQVELTFNQGGEVKQIIASCIDINFSILCNELPIGNNGVELAESLYTLTETCNSPDWLNYVDEKGLEFSWSGGNTVTVTFDNAFDCQVDLNTQVFKFEIKNHPSYNFGSPLTEGGFYIDFGGSSCNGFLPAIPNNQRFSFSTDFDDYANNVFTQLFNDFQSNYNSTVVMDLQSGVSAVYTVFVDIAYIQSNYATDICAKGWSICDYTTIKGTFAKGGMKIDILEEECCITDCCDDTVTVVYTDTSPIPNEDRVFMDLEFIDGGDLAAIAFKQCGTLIYSFSISNNACYNTYLFGHATPADLAQGLMDFYNNCPDVSWVSYIASTNLVLTLISPTVVRWEQDIQFPNCCGATNGHGYNVGDRIVTNIINYDCFTIPPQHFTSDVLCCKLDVDSEVVRISDRQKYTWRDECVNDAGFLYLNTFGVNEMVYFEGVVLESTTTDRKNAVDLSVVERNEPNTTNILDREMNMLSGDGRKVYEIDTNVFDRNHKQRLTEFFHSTKWRLLDKYQEEIGCFTSGCSPTVTTCFVPEGYTVARIFLDLVGTYNTVGTTTNIVIDATTILDDTNTYPDAATEFQAIYDQLVALGYPIKTYPTGYMDIYIPTSLFACGSTMNVTSDKFNIAQTTIQPTCCENQQPCPDPNATGFAVITFTDGGTLDYFGIGDCVDIDFTSYTCPQPTGASAADLATSFVDWFSSCFEYTNPANVVVNKIGTTVVSIQVDGCCKALPIFMFTGGVANYDVVQPVLTPDSEPCSYSLVEEQGFLVECDAGIGDSIVEVEKFTPINLTSKDIAIRDDIEGFVEITLKFENSNTHNAI